MRKIHPGASRFPFGGRKQMVEVAKEELWSNERQGGALPPAEAGGPNHGSGGEGLARGERESTL
jgi:hypothetical protein